MLIQLPNAFGDAATNMAIDAALLETIPTGLATFRHYGWLEPAATFGYAQSHTRVVSELAAPPHTSAGPHATLIRRLTGGGIVDHRNDWTYALVLHRSLPAVGQPATQLYRQVHQAIREALACFGIETRLAPCPKTCTPKNTPSAKTPRSSQSDGAHTANPAYSCFRSPAADDVLRASDGRKIAGAAMKRTRRALMIQGSIDLAALPDAFDYAQFKDEFAPHIATLLSLAPGTLEDIRPLFNSQRIAALKTQFASPTWNQKR